MMSLLKIRSPSRKFGQNIRRTPSDCLALPICSEVPYYNKVACTLTRQDNLTGLDVGRIICPNFPAGKFIFFTSVVQLTAVEEDFPTQAHLLNAPK